MSNWLCCGRRRYSLLAWPSHTGLWCHIQERWWLSSTPCHLPHAIYGTLQLSPPPLFGAWAATHIHLHTMLDRDEWAVVMSNGVLDWAREDTWTAMIDRSPCGTGTCAVMAERWPSTQRHPAPIQQQSNLHPANNNPTCTQRLAIVLLSLLLAHRCRNCVSRSSQPVKSLCNTLACGTHDCSAF